MEQSKIIDTLETYHGAGEDVDYVAMPKASCQRASVLLYLGKASYDIKVVHSDGFTWAMS